MEFVAGVWHAIFGEDGFEATFVKRPVVGNQWEALDALLNLSPHFRERGLPVGVASGESVNCCGPLIIVVRRRLNKAVEAIDNLAVSHNDYADAANAASPAVGCFKIYGCKIFHRCEYFSAKLT